MAEKIYYCKFCDKTYSSKSQFNDECPNCRAPLLMTGMNAEDWRALTELDKPAVRESFIKMYDEKYPPRNKPLEPKEHEELRNRVMQNRPSSNENRNSTSHVLNGIGALIVLVGLALLMLSIYIGGGNRGSLTYGVAAFVACIIQGALFMALGEIIRLLQILVDRS